MSQWRHAVFCLRVFFQMSICSGFFIRIQSEPHSNAPLPCSIWTPSHRTPFRLSNCCAKSPEVV